MFYGFYRSHKTDLNVGVEKLLKRAKRYDFTIYLRFIIVYLLIIS